TVPETSTAPIGSRYFFDCVNYCIARWLSHFSLQTHNLTVDLGHHRIVLLVLHFRDKDFALIKFESANILDIQTSTEQDLHVLRHLKRVVALENFHSCLSCKSYALAVPQSARLFRAQILMPNDYSPESQRHPVCISLFTV